MPIKDPNVACRGRRPASSALFDAAQPERAAVRSTACFLEVLDFDGEGGLVSLANAPANVTGPASSKRIAQLDGFRVLYVALDMPETDRVRKGEAATTAALVDDQLGDDLDLVFTNGSAMAVALQMVQLSIVAHPRVRRIVFERDLPLSTAVQQVAMIYWGYKD